MKKNKNKKIGRVWDDSKGKADPKSMAILDQSEKKDLDRSKTNENIKNF